MSLGKRLISTGGASSGDPRIDGQGSEATAKWVLSTGTTNVLYYHGSANPNNTFSSVSVGSSYIQDALWDGFTWIITTGSGIYQTSDSSCASGWTLVVPQAGNQYGGYIVPVPGGNLVIMGNNTNSVPTVAYTTVIDGTVSSSNWNTKSLGISGDTFLAAATNTRVVWGRRIDSGTAPQFYYTSNDNDWFLENGWTGLQLSGSPPWGTRFATDGTNIIGARRGYNGVFYASGLGASTTDQSMGSDYWQNLSYSNGYWVAAHGNVYYTKTTYNGSWSSRSTSTSTYNTPFYYNGTYWVAGMNYANTNSEALVYKSSLLNGNSYVAQGTIGSASASYVRMFRPSKLYKYGGWNNLGTSITTFG